MLNGLINTLDLKFVYDLIIDIYVTLGKAYSLLLDMISVGTNVESSSKLVGFTKTIYVLGAIFMLFRITVSFLNMLIDPDKTNDKQTGAGAILKRVFVSLILLIVLTPGSYVFNLLDRIETTVIFGEDSLLNTAVRGAGMKAMTSTASSSSSKNTTSVKEFDCYAYSYNEFSLKGDVFTNFIYKWQSTWSNLAFDLFGSEAELDDNSLYSLTNLIDATHIKITNSKASGYTEISGSPGWYAKYVGDKAESQNYTFVTYGNNFSSSGYSKGFTGCPANITIKDNETTISSQYQQSFINKTLDFLSPFPIEGKRYNNPLYDSEEKLFNALGFLYYEKHRTINNTISGSGDKEIYNIAKSLGETYTSVNTTGLTEDVISFSRSILLTFITSSDGSESTLAEDFNDILYNSVASDRLWKQINGKNATYNMDKLLALIVGIAVTVYLLFLCIDVVIRNLKLALLRVIAPIPVISYIDPKDKIFNEWLKMYINTYLDLFLKLFAISVSTALIQSIIETQTLRGWERLLFIIGLLLFAKAVPTILSKIFGIEVSAGSFKEIGKMAKTGLGIAAGGAVAAGAGLISGGIAGSAVQGGRGKKILGAIGGGLLGAARGGLRGIGSGYRGDVLGGARSITSSNVRVANANRSGSSFWGRTFSQAAHTVGMRDAYERAQAEYEGNDAFVKAATSTEDLAMEIARKQAGKQAERKTKDGTAVDQVFEELDKATRIYDDYHSGKYTGSLTAMQIERNKSKAEKAAREKVINDTYSGNISGYVDYETDVDREQLMNSIRATETLGSQVGSSMFKQEQDEDGNARTIWNKESRDKAKSASIKAKGEMDKYKPDHDAASQTS